MSNSIADEWTPLTDEALAELERLAKAATAGVRVYTYDENAGETLVSSNDPTADAKLFAALDRETILALVEEVRGLRDAVRGLLGYRDGAEP